MLAPPLNSGPQIFQLKPSQIDFVSSTEQFPAYIAAIGCIDGKELINGVPIAEWAGGKTRTLFGDYDSSASWIKGITDLYRVSTRAGKQVVVTRGHRFLTPTGWHPLADLSFGDLIACDAFSHEVPVSERLPNFLGRYSSGSRLSGGLPTPAGVAYLDKLRQFRTTDDGSNAWALDRFLSIGDSVYQDVRRPCGEQSPFVEVSSAQALHGLKSSLQSVQKILPQGNAPQSRPLEAQSQVDASADETALSLLDSKCANVVPYWDNITEIRFVRKGQYYDITVPVAEHYSASGIWHHNTGKTSAMIHRAMILSEAPNNLGVIIRRNFVDLRDSTMRDFTLYTGINVSVDTKEAKLPNGSVIMFRHGDELPVLKNLNLGFFAIEQAEEFPDSTPWDYLMMRLRRQVPFRSGFIVANANGHNWVYDKWVKNGPPKNHATIQAVTADFSDILPPDYIENLKSNLPERLYRRFVENSHEIAEGLVYSEWDESKHIIDPFEIPATWERGFVLDHGFRNPTAVLWYAIDFDGNIVLYDEHYERERPISYHASRIKERGLTQGYCDPSVFNKTQSKGGNIYSLADEYREEGIELTAASKEEEYARIARVNEMLKSLRIKCFRSLTNFRQEIANWKWKPQNPSQVGMNMKEEPEDRGNHLMDCTSYLISSRFPATDRGEPKFERKSPVWWKRMAQRQSDHMVTRGEYFDAR